MIAKTRRRRHLKPRKPDGYTNELYGRGLHDDDLEPCESPKSPGDDDRIESKVLARGTADLGPLAAEQPWHKTLGCYGVDYEPSTGIWIPRWVGYTIRKPNRVRLLSWLLWWFDDEESRSSSWNVGGLGRGTDRTDRHPFPPCRAQVRDVKGNRCLGTSLQQISDEINLDPVTVRRNLQSLETQGILTTQKMKTGEYFGNLLISLNAEPLARLYFNATGDRVAYDEFLSEEPSFQVFPKRAAFERAREQGGSGLFHEFLDDDDDDKLDLSDHVDEFPLGWFESETRRRALNRHRRIDTRTHRLLPVALGTWASDRVFFACEKKAGPAWLLSQILWWFSHRIVGGENLGSRARIVRHGHLWIAKSPRQLRGETGLPVRSVRDYLDYLINERSFLAADKWVYDRHRDRNQKTLHLRVVPDKLNDALTSDEVEDAVLLMEERRMEESK